MIDPDEDDDHGPLRVLPAREPEEIRRELNALDEEQRARAGDRLRRVAPIVPVVPLLDDPDTLEADAARLEEDAAENERPRAWEPWGWRTERLAQAAAQRRTAAELRRRAMGMRQGVVLDAAAE